jgi:hypothetical protein
VTAFGDRKLAGDRRKDGTNFIPQSEQNRNGDDGNKSQDQGVLDEGLAFSRARLAARLIFGIHAVAQLLL